MSKILELKLVNKYKIIRIPETLLSAENVKEAEIAILNFKSIQEDRKNTVFFRGGLLFMYKISKLILFEKK